MPADIALRSRALRPTSLDEIARTVRVTWSTGAACMREDMTGPFREVLSLAPGHVRLDRLKGAPVLNAHRRTTMDDVLGAVVDAGIDQGEGWAVLKFSDRPDVEPVWRDVAEGIIRNVSVGYSVQKWTETVGADGIRVKTAVAWTPVEISLVPLPADEGAFIRSDHMEHETGAEAGVEAPPPPQITTRAAINAEIRAIARVAGLDASFADGLIDREASLDDARAAAFREMGTRGAPAIRTDRAVTVGRDFEDPAVRAGWMGEALFTRIDPSHTPSEAARQYVGFSLPEMGREILRTRGISTTGLSGDAVITRALHTTSDFAVILGDTVGRSLRQAYAAAPAGVRRLGRQTSARDFRAKHRVQLSEAPTLLKVNESGEFKSGTMVEASESYRIDTFGRIIGISRQALINDDLGAFTDLSRRFGQAAAEFEAAFVVKLMIGATGTGPVMKDGNTLFAAAHGNLPAVGLDLTEDGLSAARLAMRRQKGLSGMPIDVTPRYLLVPAALETRAEKLLAAIRPATSDDVNPHAGKLDLVVDARLDDVSDSRWYLAADPSMIDGLEYAYLEGAPGPQIESRNGFEVDGVQVKIRLDYGAGFVDWRGWFASEGA